MTPECWHRVDDFRNYAEVEWLAAWLRAEINSGDAELMPVGTPYSGSANLTEEWFLHLATARIWRLVWPDGPFHGLFEEVGLDRAGES